MENLQLRKEILVLKIKMRRNHIASLEILLSTYRNMKSTLFNHDRITKANNPVFIQQKIGYTISRINLNIEILSQLEAELASLEENT